MVLRLGEMKIVNKTPAQKASLPGFLSHFLETPSALLGLPDRGQFIIQPLARELNQKKKVNSSLPALLQIRLVRLSHQQMQQHP